MTCYNCGVTTPEAARRCDSCDHVLRIGPFAIVSAVGTPGAFGEVFECIKPGIERHVAVKQFHRGINLIAIENEINALAISPHPNIVRILEWSVADNYIVYKLEAESLSGLMLGLDDEARMDQFCVLATSLAEALRHAHQEYRYHRDIKPDNVLIGFDGTVRLADFGIAALLTSTQQPRHTIAGTPGFMAPEVYHDGTEYDQRADIYSLGVLLYQFLTSQLPWQHDLTEQLTPSELYRRQDRDEGMPLAGVAPFVPNAVTELIESMISLDPSTRPRNATAVLSIVKGWCLRDTPERELNLAELQYAIDSIYSRANVTRSLSDILARLTARSAALSRGLSSRMSEVDRENLKYNLLSSFSWLCVLASFANTTIAEALELKFGDGCPYCGETSCTCHDLTIADIVEGNQRRLDRLLGRRGLHPESELRLDEYQTRLTTLYGEKNGKRSAVELAMLLLQAGGQVADASLRYQAENPTRTVVLHLELADVAAWLLALADRIKNEFQIDLYQLILEQYCPEGQWVCTRCAHSTCTCPTGYEMNFVDGWSLEQP